MKRKIRMTLWVGVEISDHTFGGLSIPDFTEKFKERSRRVWNIGEDKFRLPNESSSHFGDLEFYFLDCWWGSSDHFYIKDKLVLGS